MNPSSDTRSAANTVIELKRAAHSCSSMQALEICISLLRWRASGPMRFGRGHAVQRACRLVPYQKLLLFTFQDDGKMSLASLGTSLLAKTSSPCRSLTLAKGSASAGHHRNQINIARCRGKHRENKKRQQRE